MSVIKIAKGLDLPLAGAPDQRIEPAAVAPCVAIIGADHVGLKPRVLVGVGDRVLRGQRVIEDKAVPGVTLTAPAAGTVSAIHRGERRAFQSLVIDVEEGDDPAADQVAFASFQNLPPESLSPEEITALLVESGLWTSLRARPFSRTPEPGTQPRVLFITAIDTRPHAPSVDAVLAGRMDDFQTGVACLAKLTAGPTYVCVAPDSAVAVPERPGIQRVAFAGPHPAGLAGTHIHFLDPADLERPVWHIGYQDVAAVGRLLRTGVLDTGRVVSLAGPCARDPRIVRTRMGAALDPLLHGQIVGDSEAVRVISGSVLDGRTAMGPIHGYLGRYSAQIAVVAEPREREMFGWIRPGGEKFSIWAVVFGAFRKNGGVNLTTSTQGGYRAMVPIGSFERVMPLDLMPTFLLRALLMDNMEDAVELGCLELDEEDLALCTFVCPGKAEYGPLLRHILTRIEKEAV